LPVALDGVTGWLQVDRTRSPRVERWPSFAVFRGGKIERIDVRRTDVMRTDALRTDVTREVAR
jgi:hypothetical protein